MSRFPMISIILGTYNDGKIIGNTLNHLLEKIRYPNYEVILASDGERIIMKHKRLKVTHSNERRGVTKALYDAIKMSKGEIIVHSASDYRYRNPSKVLFLIARHFEEEKVGGLMFEGEDPPNLAEMRKENINEYSQIVLYNVIKDWRRKFKYVYAGFKYPIVCHAFRKNLVRDMNPKSINDDAEFAYSLLEKGYCLKLADDVKFYSIVETSTKDAIRKRYSRTTAGWLSSNRIGKIDLFRFYFFIFYYFLKKRRNYSTEEKRAFNHAIWMFLKSLPTAWKNRSKPQTEAWKTYR